MITKGRRVESENPLLGIVSLSGPDAVWFSELHAKGLERLHDRGIRTKEGATVQTSHYYLAGEPKVIAQGLHQMFQTEDVDAIMCAGGGINMNKVLPFIDFELLRENPKPFIGISNITVLLVAMLKYGLASFHGPFSIWSYGLDGRPTDYTHRNWLEAIKGYTGKLAPASDWKIFREGAAQGALIGGNISSLGTVVGTSYCPVELFDGKILILEEIDEDYAKLDAILTHMDLLGIFDRISGLIVGKLPDCRPPEQVEMSLEDFLGLVFDSYSFPVIYECDFGHVADNLCLPIGCAVEMSACQNSAEIVVLEPGVVQ